VQEIVLIIHLDEQVADETMEDVIEPAVTPLSRSPPLLNMESHLVASIIVLHSEDGH